MANFSIGQVHQLYVISGYNASVTAASAVGTIGAVQAIDDIRGKEIMFKYKGVESVLPSDFIQIQNIGYAKAIPASDMVTVMKKYEVALNDSLVSGQDYVLGINFRNFFSSGDASQYFKDAAVHATASMTASEFYNAMVSSLNSAFSREPGATSTTNPYLSFSIKEKGGGGSDATDAVAIVIEEKPQEWERGTKKARRIMFDVVPSTIYTGSDDVVWGTVTDATPAKGSAVVGTNAVGNGQNIADLEWFCMGERGDQYRGAGWPHVINTKYLVDPTAQYHVLEIHYAFTDTGVNSYRTEKEITVVAPATTAGKSALNSFIGAINSATSLSIATLS